MISQIERGAVWCCVPAQAAVIVMDVMEVECEVCGSKEDTLQDPILLCDGKHIAEVNTHFNRVPYQASPAAYQGPLNPKTPPYTISSK